MSWVLSIDKNDISTAAISEGPSRPLQEGEARLRVDRFALTANNITYAAFGEAMRYWDFFPGSSSEGHLPVWGFAEVEECRATGGLEIGERIYGYFPAGDELIVEPGRIDAGSFVDTSPHRADLPPAYNRYTRCASDPGYRADLEAVQMVLQPLFITSFLIDLHLRDTGFLGARRVSLTSASSKTAIALAFLLDRDRSHGIEIEAITSPGNRRFVEALGYYDRVALYDDVADMEAEPSRLVIDFAGDSAVNKAIHSRLGDALAGNIRVGGAHWENSAPPGAMPGPKPVFFFAPDHVRDRIKEWGAGEFGRRYGEAWLAFASEGRALFEFEERSGAEATLASYRALIDGKVPAKQALTLQA
jgi:hypothetical protein